MWYVRKCAIKCNHKANVQIYKYFSRQPMLTIVWQPADTSPSNSKNNNNNNKFQSGIFPFANIQIAISICTLCPPLSQNFRYACLSRCFHFLFTLSLSVFRFRVRSFCECDTKCHDNSAHQTKREDIQIAGNEVSSRWKNQPRSLSNNWILLCVNTGMTVWSWSYNDYAKQRSGSVYFSSLLWTKLTVIIIICFNTIYAFAQMLIRPGHFITISDSLFGQWHWQSFKNIQFSTQFSLFGFDVVLFCQPSAAQCIT